MRRFIWVAAVVTMALLFWRGGGQQLPTEAPQDAWFQQNVLQPSLKRPILVKFGATWCGPCNRMEPELTKLETELRGRVGVVQVDVDERRGLAEHFKVGGIPDTVVFSQGKAVARFVGYRNSEAMADFVRPFLTTESVDVAAR